MPSGNHEGKTVYERRSRIILQKESARHLHLCEGGNFWAWAYFQQMTDPVGWRRGTGWLFPSVTVVASPAAGSLLAGRMRNTTLLQNWPAA